MIFHYFKINKLKKTAKRCSFAAAKSKRSVTLLTWQVAALWSKSSRQYVYQPQAARSFLPSFHCGEIFHGTLFSYNGWSLQVLSESPDAETIKEKKTKNCTLSHQNLPQKLRSNHD